MHKKIPALKKLLEIHPLDEQEILNHRSFLLEHRKNFYTSIQAWATKHDFAATHDPKELLLEGFYEALVSGDYEHDFHAILYRQVIHWYHLRLREDDVLILLSRMWQALQDRSAQRTNMRVERALCLVVELCRIVAVDILRLSGQLQAIREKSEYETARIHQAFSLLAANLPDELVQAYMDHQEWMHASISLILGATPDPHASIPDSAKCNLARWLERGGRGIIPAHEWPEFDAAHGKVHEMATLIHAHAARHQTEHLFSQLSELEKASAVVSRTLLRCIDESITQFASYDPLTRLRNRSTLSSVFQREGALATRFGKTLGAILLDIDHFKKINDQYGHLFGDQVLIELSQCLRQQIRREDVLFRWGGEEFLVIGMSDNTNHGSITTMAERIRQEVEQTVFCHNTPTPIQFTVSAGVVEFSPSDTTMSMEQIFDHADKLLYQAKQTGRNRVVSELLAVPSTEL